MTIPNERLVIELLPTISNKTLGYISRMRTLSAFTGQYVEGAGISASLQISKNIAFSEIVERYITHEILKSNDFVLCEEHNVFNNKTIKQTILEKILIIENRTIAASACHPCRETAAFATYCEFIERDHNRIFGTSQHPEKELTFFPLLNKFITQKIHSIARFKNLTFYIAWNRRFQPIPTLIGIAVDKELHRFYMASAASFDPHQSIKKILNDFTKLFIIELTAEEKNIDKNFYHSTTKMPSFVKNLINHGNASDAYIKQNMTYFPNHKCAIEIINTNNFIKSSNLYLAIVSQPNNSLRNISEVEELLS